MEVGLNKIENVTILTLKGRANVSSVTKLENVCKKILEKNENNVLLDGTNLDFISSACLRVLLMLAKEIKKNAGRLAVAHLNDVVREIFEISGFIELFPAYENVVTGLSHFQK